MSLRSRGLRPWAVLRRAGIRKVWGSVVEATLLRVWGLGVREFKGFRGGGGLESRFRVRRSRGLGLTVARKTEKGTILAESLAPALLHMGQRVIFRELRQACLVKVCNASLISKSLQPLTS